MLEQIYVPHGHEDLMADVEQSAVLLVPTKGGKTTARRYVELSNAKRSQQDTLVVVYDYGRKMATAAGSDLESHTPFFLAAVAHSMWKFITSNMSIFLAARAWSEPWWWRLLDQYLPGEPLESHLYGLLNLYDPEGLLFESDILTFSQKPYLKQLFDQLAERATLGDLRAICFNLGIKDENFSPNLFDKIRELLRHLDSQRRISDLIEQAVGFWPKVDWEKYAPPAGEKSNGEDLALHEQMLKSFKRSRNLQFTPFANNSGFVEALHTLSKHLPDLSIEKVHLLVDGAEKDNLEALRAAIGSLLSESGLHVPGFSWKFFLPEMVEDVVNKSLAYRRMDVPTRVAHWDEKRLFAMLEGRVFWGSQTTSALNALGESPDLPKLDQELVALIESDPAGWGKPRTLLWSGNELVDYLERTGKPLTRETWEMFKKDEFSAHARVVGVGEKGTEK